MAPKKTVNLTLRCSDQANPEYVQALETVLSSSDHVEFSVRRDEALHHDQLIHLERDGFITSTILLLTAEQFLLSLSSNSLLNTCRNVMQSARTLLFDWTTLASAAHQQPASSFFGAQALKPMLIVTFGLGVLCESMFDRRRKNQVCSMWGSKILHLNLSIQRQPNDDIFIDALFRYSSASNERHTDSSNLKFPPMLMEPVPDLSLSLFVTTQGHVQLHDVSVSGVCRAIIQNS